MALFLSITYSLGLISIGSSAAPASVTRIKVTHTHEIDHHDHDHDHEDHASANEENSNDNQTHEHTHEILVIASTCYLSVKQSQVIQYIECKAAFPPPTAQNPPLEPALNSIFRPPIA